MLLNPADIDPTWLRAHECGLTEIVGNQYTVEKIYYPIGTGPHGQNCVYFLHSNSSPVYVNLYPGYQNSPDSAFEVGAVYEVMGHLPNTTSGTTVFLKKVSKVDPGVLWGEIVHPNPPVPDKNGWFYFAHPKGGYPSAGFLDGTILIKYKKSPDTLIGYTGKFLSMTKSIWVSLGTNTLYLPSTLGSLSSWKPVLPDFAEKIIWKWHEKDWAALKGPNHSQVLAKTFQAKAHSKWGVYPETKPYPKTDLEFLLD